MRVKIEDNSKYQALLDHLSEEDKKAFQKEYYETKTLVPEILKKFGLSGIKENRVYKCFPNEVSETKKCPYCDIPLERNAISRMGFRYDVDLWICSNCGHNTCNNCNCENCWNAKELYAKNQRKLKRLVLQGLLRDTYISPIDIEKISLRNKVVIGAVLRGGITSDCERIRPFCEMGAPIFPETINSDKVISALLNRQIIRIHEDNDIDNFTMNEDGTDLVYDQKKIEYIFNVQKNGSKEEAVKEFLAPQKVENDKDEILQLWKDILYLEAISLFLYKMREYHFNYIVGKETELFFEEALKNLTLEELYSIIRKSVLRTAANSVKNKNMSKRQAANSALTIIRALYDKTMSGNMARTSYSIPVNPAQSLVSQYFFSTFVGLYDKYSSMIPRVV